MNKLLVIALLLACQAVEAQIVTPVATVDFVKIQNGRTKQALFFYENNWKVYRELALSKGYIKSYSLLTSLKDTVKGFDVVLITEYADSLQLKSSEARFQQIINEVRPSGPKLLDSFKPNDFRRNAFFKTFNTVFSPNSKPPKRKS